MTKETARGKYAATSDTILAAVMASSSASSSAGAACPVDHSSPGWQEMASSLPVDHPPIPSSSTAPRHLSQERETSSIPRADSEEKWVYPSQAQFYAAMERKNHDPKANDMPVLVPIHNAVNERAWSELLKWEQGTGAEKCGGIKLVSFKGRPKDRTIRALFNMALGYASVQSKLNSSPETN